MTIKKKLLLSIVLAFVFMSVVGIFVYREVQNVRQNVAETQGAQDILRDRVFRLTLLYEYLAHHEERSKEQWRLLTSEIQKNKSSHISLFNTHEAQAIVSEIYNSADIINVLFEKLILHHEMVAQTGPADQLLADDYEKTVSDQISAASLVNAQRARQLVIDSLNSLQRSEDTLVFVLVVSGLALLFLFIIFYLYYNQYVLKPLLTLTQVTKSFITGNLQKRSPISSKDEIGVLSSAFNEMAAKLQEMYVGLEEKVEERTRSLEESKNHFLKLTERFNFATKSAHIGVWEWDVVQNVLTWDDQMYALYGIKEEDFSGAYDAWQKGLHPDDKKLGDEAINLALEGKKDFNITFRVVWPNGEVHDVRAFASIERDGDGKPLKMVGVNWDVTKEMEVDKAKSEFVSLASHQLRTPLSSINWYAEMLESGDAGPLSEKQHEFLKEIYIGSQRMVGLVNALLNVSRLELGRLTVEPSPTDLVALAKVIIAELKPIIEKNQLTLTEQYAKSLPYANVDPKLISIVFQNLLTNAVKYTKEKGIIDFSIEMKKAADTLGERSVATDSYAISVKDTGIGIPANKQSVMFTKLFRADNARERDQDGTGLGLYIVKEIVTLAGGAVWYDSIEGKGTTFYVLLPVEGMTKSLGKTSLK